MTALKRVGAAFVSKAGYKGLAAGSNTAMRCLVAASLLMLPSVLVKYVKIRER